MSAPVRIQHIVQLTRHCYTLLRSVAVTGHRKRPHRVLRGIEMSTSKQIAAFCALVMSAAAFNVSAGVGKGDFEAGVSVSLTNMEITTDNGLGGETTTKSDSGNIGAS